MPDGLEKLNEITSVGTQKLQELTGIQQQPAVQQEAPAESSAPYTATLDDVLLTQSNLMLDTQLIEGVRQQTDEVFGVLREAMGQVQEIASDATVDTDALVGRLEEGFNQTKDMIMSSAMASTAKAAYEFDAYLGSAGSDARAIVRQNMAQGLTSNIINQTQQNIAALYQGHVKDVIDTTLKGAEINANVKIGAARALGDLGAQAGQLILGTNNAILSSYSQNLNAAIELMNAHTRRMDIESRERVALRQIETQERLGLEELDYKRYATEIQAQTARVTSDVWQFNRSQSESVYGKVPGIANRVKIYAGNYDPYMGAPQAPSPGMTQRSSWLRRA